MLTCTILLLYLFYYHAYLYCVNEISANSHLPLHTVHLPPHVTIIEHNIPGGKHVGRHGQ